MLIVISSLQLSRVYSQVEYGIFTKKTVKMSGMSAYRFKCLNNPIDTSLALEIWFQIHKQLYAFSVTSSFQVHSWLFPFQHSLPWAQDEFWQVCLIPQLPFDNCILEKVFFNMQENLKEQLKLFCNLTGLQVFITSLIFYHRTIEIWMKD